MIQARAFPHVQETLRIHSHLVVPGMLGGVQHLPRTGTGIRRRGARSPDRSPTSAQSTVSRLRDYSAGHRVDLAASFVYTDAFTDAPVLEMVGHPVAVYPDARLAAMAAERGWPVIGTVTKERE